MGWQPGKSEMTLHDRVSHASASWDGAKEVLFFGISEGGNWEEHGTEYVDGYSGDSPTRAEVREFIKGWFEIYHKYVRDHPAERTPRALCPSCRS